MTSVNISTTKNTVTVDEDNPSVITVSTLGPQGPAVPDGDKGDITVSDNGTVMTIDAGVVNNAKIASDAAIALSKLATGALPTGITVASANIPDLTIVNSDISASAAIAGTKISPDFGSQNIVTTGTLGSGDITVSSSKPRIDLVDTGHNSDFYFINDDGTFAIKDSTNDAGRLVIASNGQTTIYGNCDFAAGIDVTGNITVTGTVDGVDIATRNTLFGGLTSSSGVLTNGVTATTQSASDNSTKIATTAYTDTAIANLVDSSPSALNTLNELAAALGDDANFSTTVTNSIATKLPLAGGTLTGALTISDVIKRGATDSSLQLSGSTASNAGANLLLYGESHSSHANQLRFRQGSTDKFSIDGSGNATFAGNITTNGDNSFNGADYNSWWDKSDSAFKFDDNAKLKVGTGGDLEIYHSSDISRIRNTNDSGTLKIQATSNGENAINIVPNGTTEIYYDGTKKLETVAGGINVSGTVTDDGANHDGTVNFYGVNSYNAQWSKSNAYFQLLDNAKLTIGSSNDLQLYHDGTHSHIVNSTGNLRILADGAGDLVLTSKAGEEAIKCVQDGNVQLMYDNSKKLETTSTGILVTELTNSGNTTFNGSYVTFSGTNTAAWDKSNTRLLFNDNAKAAFGTGADLQIYHDGNHSYVKDSGTGSLILLGDDVLIKNAGETEDKARFHSDGSVELYYDNSKKLETITSGVRISSGDLELLDNTGSTGRLLLGNGGDLQLYHNGSHSYIVDAGTGSLVINSDSFYINNAADNETQFKATENGAVELYYDGSKKLETYSGGIRTFDHISCGGSVVVADNNKFLAGDGDDLQIYHDGSHSRIVDAGTGYIKIQSDQVAILNADDTEQMIQAWTNGSVALYYDNSKKIQTASHGIDVLDDLVFDNGTNAGKDINWSESTNTLLFQDSVYAAFGASNDLKIFHDGSNSYLDNNTGSLNIRTNVNSDVGGNIYIKPHHNEDGITVIHDGSVELYYDNSKKAQTYADGLNVLGDFWIDNQVNAGRDVWFDESADTFKFYTNVKATFGTGNELQIYHNGTDSYIDNVTGNLQLRVASSEKTAVGVPNGAIELYYDNSKKLETTANGIKLGAGSGAAASTYYDDIVIDNSGTASGAAGGTGITLVSGNDTWGSLSFSDSDADQQGAVKYDHSNNLMRFRVNAATALEIDSSQNATFSGNVSLGETLTVTGANPNITFVDSDNNPDYKIYASNAVLTVLDSTNSVNALTLSKDSATFSGDATVGGDLKVAAVSGTANILKIPGHDGTNANQGCEINHQSGHFQVTNTVGNTYFQSHGQFNLRGNHGGTTESMLIANTGGAVELYYDNSKKLETTSSGVKFTGTTSHMNWLQGTDDDKLRFNDGVKATFGNSDDLRIYHDGSHSFIKNSTGNLQLMSDEFRVKSNTGNEAIIQASLNGSVQLYYDNSLKFATKTYGVFIDGHLQMDDSDIIKLGNSNDLQLYHSGSNSFIKHVGTGDLFVQCDNGEDIYLRPKANEDGVKVISDGAVELYYDSAKQCETVDGGMNWADGKRAYFGNSSDLQVYHDGTHSKIIHTTGSGNAYLASDSLILSNTAMSEYYVQGTVNGSAELYYDNSKKLDTNSGGVKVHGNIDIDDNNKLRVGTSSDLQIYHDGSNSYIDDGGAGRIFIESNSGVTLQTSNGAETTAQFNNAGAVKLYYDDSKKFETTAAGVQFTGTEVKGPDSCKFVAGTSGDADFFHDGSATYLRNQTGDLCIRSDNHILFQPYSADELFAKFIDDGAVELYYDNSKKFETTSTGIKVSGADSDDQIKIVASGTHANGVIDFESPGNGGGVIKTQGTTALTLDNSQNATFAGTVTCSSLTESSDIALKTNIEPITNVLDKINQITGYKYDFTKSNSSSIGVIAQDVEKVFPELVHGEEGTKSLQYSGLIGALIESVKELSKKVAALEAG